MARDSSIPPGSFDEILAWLHPDRDVAGQMYVQLYNDLIKIFEWNRCSDPEGLTDKVVDRVARRVHDLRKTYVGDPRLYFYGVARNVIKEDKNKIKPHVPLDEIDLPANTTSEAEEIEHLRQECLHSCLQKLSKVQRELILSYYEKEKQAKIDHRLELARQLGTSVRTLRVRIYRIRGILEQCVKRCCDPAEGK